MARRLIQETFEYEFPSEDDALVAPHSLDACVQGVDSLQCLQDGVLGRRVTIGAELDEEELAGLEASLDAWASSSGGIRVS